MNINKKNYGLLYKKYYFQLLTLIPIKKSVKFKIYSIFHIGFFNIKEEFY